MSCPVPTDSPRVDPASLCRSRFPGSTLIVQKDTKHMRSLHTKIRDKNCSRNDFVFYADRLIRMLLEDALDTVGYEEKMIVTPTGSNFVGSEMMEDVCGVSILRAGESMEHVLREIVKGVKIGKILIQRDEGTQAKVAKLFYARLPPSIQQSRVLLLDPMLASGGSVICAIKYLIEAGVAEEKITFVNLISCLEGLGKLFTAFPKVTVVTSMFVVSFFH